jgi:uncharacterized protein YegP (UPF0339 family)
MGKFEMYKSGDQFRYRLKAANGQNILSGEAYNSKQGCKDGIASVKKNASLQERYEMKEGKGGKHYFNLKAGNSQVIGSSQQYSSAEACKGGMESVMKNAPDAEIVEE